MRVLLKMIAFGLAVGCLSYTSRAVDPCDPAGATVAENKVCNGNTPNACETESSYWYGNSCKANTRTISVSTDNFGCKSAGNNPAPPMLGSRCVDSGQNAVCETMAYCTMRTPPPVSTTYWFPGLEGVPAGYYTFTTQGSPACTSGPPMPRTSPTKTTVACTSGLI